MFKLIRMSGGMYSYQKVTKVKKLKELSLCKLIVQCA